MSVSVPDLHTAAIYGGIFAAAIVKKTRSFSLVPECAAEAE